MKSISVFVLAAALPAAAFANYRVEVNAIDIKGVGASLGTVVITESPKGGLEFKPELKGLPPGAHGFHVHEFANCAARAKDGKMSAGEQAGGHWDPDKTGKHGAPSGGGHKGDLPPLQVAANGTDRKSVV